MKHYFDYAAATPMSTSVKAAMEPYFSERFYNPSALYLPAREVKQDLEKARRLVASVLGCRPQGITFTAGGTEANNLAIHGVMARYPGANCVISAMEHDAVMQPAAKYTRKLVPVKPDGLIDPYTLAKLIDDETVLVSVMYVNNEVGTVQPISKISKLLKEIRQERVKKGNNLPLYFHTDACQAPNLLNMLPSTLGVDMLTLNGGKIYGPKQSGILFVKTGIELEPLVYGGGQERNIRSGTENVPGCIGFAAALAETAGMRETEMLRLAGIIGAGYEFISSELPDAVINGSKTNRLPNNLHLTFPGVDNERLMMELDGKGYQVAVGSACSASSDEPSHVLKAIGLSDEAARSSLRITMGRGTDKEDLLGLLAAIKSLIIS